MLAGTGFGVWHGGRHLASARWADVSQVRAFNQDGATAERVVVALRLRDGTEILIQDDLPGFESFLVAAEARLRGMPRRSAWWPGVTEAPPAQNETLLFERGSSRG